MEVIFQNINVTSILTNSGVFVGDNCMNYWQSNLKQNMSIGIVIGKNNFIIRNTNILNDNDLVDNPIQGSSTSSPSPPETHKL
ncbi:MAG: hypothetical protein ACI35O_13490 [Bacillaceae bacterium]